MLSRDLCMLRHQLAHHVHGGVFLSPGQVTSLVETLTDLADRAHELERSAVPAGQRLTSEHLSDPKIALFPIAPLRTAYHPGDAS